MKKFALALVTASAAILGFGVAAQAQTYSPSVSVGAVSPGGSYTDTFINCAPGETITFTQPESTPTSSTGVCSSTRTAVASFGAAPSAVGSFTVTATGTVSGEVATVFSIAAAGTKAPAAVPVSGLPATGSSGMGTTTCIAISLLVVGLGLFVVAQIRRRQPSVA